MTGSTVIRCAACQASVNAAAIGCPECGADPRSGARRCTNCGAPLAAAATSCEACGRFIPFAECPWCGAEPPRGAPFCLACGGWLGPPDPPLVDEAVCPRCGAPGWPGAAYCPFCAIPLELRQVVAPAAVTDFVQAHGAGTPFAPKPTGTPGIGIAGFVLAVIGSPVLGLILSTVGYVQANRERRPSGLPLAGIIISVGWAVLIVGVLVATS